MATWRLLVHDPDGTLRTTITPEDPVDRLGWSVRGDGDCLDAVIVGSGLDLRARDIVGIQVTPTPDGDEDDLEAVWWGWVITVGDKNDPGLQEWRLVGGSQRLREVINRLTRINGSDVARMAKAALDLNFGTSQFRQLPTGIRYDDARFPDTGFELGLRAPHFETVGETLDALAAAVPQFEVLGGGPSYVYDGRTYHPGQVVPPVSWGVRAGREGGVPAEPGGWIFFERVDDADATGPGAYSRGEEFDELRDGLTIQWEPIAADVVIDSVVVVVADQPSNELTEVPDHSAFGTPSSVGGPYDPVAYVLERALEKPYDAWKRVEAPTLDVFKHVPFVDGWTKAVEVSNPGNIIDADPATYSSNTESAVEFEVRIEGSDWTSLAHKPTATKIRYSALRGGFRLRIAPTAADFGLGNSWELKLEDTEGAQREVVVVHPWPHTPADGASWTIDYGGDAVDDVQPDDLRVYDLQALALDEEVVDRVARSHLKPPPQRVGTVDVPNRILKPSTRLRLTLASGEQLDLPVATLQHAVTREAGLTTTVRLGQELPAPLQAEKDQLARRVDQAATRRSQ